jgi:hypothetical protein
MEGHDDRPIPDSQFPIPDVFKIHDSRFTIHQFAGGIGATGFAGNR